MVYALGITMHYLLTGIEPNKPPYETKPIRKIKPTLPKGLEYIIEKCIKKNPDERYQNCDELIFDLDNYMDLPRETSIFKKMFKKK